ncbi:hypothetical protein [[Clostridium] colinum]|uniref:hypothetical protein n=1 Tax=[Clostridium] colinum TaxID=36835 RepID=UPI0020259179|nr:hypothetical protein [[Clostridium] colinum]
MIVTEKDLIILTIASIFMIINFFVILRKEGFFISIIIDIFILFLIKDSLGNAINYLQQEKSTNIEKIVEEKVKQELQKRE